MLGIKIGIVLAAAALAWMLAHGKPDNGED